MGARLLLALLFAIYLSERVSCCSRSAFTNCNDGRFKGPIRTIIDNGPTAIAQASADNGEFLANVVKPIFSEPEFITPDVIGELVVGVIGAILHATNVNPSPSADFYSPITEKLYEEVKQLGIWVDPNIKVAAVNALDNDLGSSDTGIFGRVEDLIRITFGSEAGTTEERRTELIQLQEMLQDNDVYDHFVPSTDAAGYEASLPYFRVFGDLFFSCLLDQIQAAKLLGYSSEVADIAEEIQTRADTFFKHYVGALNAIFREHSDIEEPKCTADTYLVPSGWWIFITYTRVADFKCTVEMGGEICSIESTECDSEDANEVNILKDAITEKRNSFISNRRSDLSTYWLNQVGYVVYNWNGIANEVENQVALM